MRTVRTVPPSRTVIRIMEGLYPWRRLPGPRRGPAYPNSISPVNSV